MVQATAQAILDTLVGEGNASLPETEELYRVRKVWEAGYTEGNQIFAGTKEGAIAACRAGYTVFDKDGNGIYTKDRGMQAEDLQNLTESEWIKKVGPLYTKDEENHGILACVSLAQAILESGYGREDLAVIGNNLHGMKSRLSGNTWPGTTWDGSSTYTKNSPEVVNGVQEIVASSFRCYDCIEDSISDHAMYLLGAANGTQQRYKGLQGEKDYEKAIEVIKKGGYATDPQYASKIINIIKKWDLECYNAGMEETVTEPKEETYLIKTTCDWLNIRKGPGKDYEITGSIREPKGAKKCYTITEERNGWGRLKSGAGWICLGYTVRQ